MESRGNPRNGRPNGLPIIRRRACDQCRSRKIACDRGSPCANCVTARVECTHSAIAPRKAAVRQKESTSGQYESKIDIIARDVGDIKRLLQGLSGLPPDEQEAPQRDSFNDPIRESLCVSAKVETPEWDHSAQVIDFIKTVVQEQDATRGLQSERVISSLRSLVQVLESPSENLRRLPAAETSAAKQSRQEKPSKESVTCILEWAQEHRNYARIDWICNILPFERFERICRKVYVDGESYTDIDFIIANGFLSYVFVEHAGIYGDKVSRENCYTCRKILTEAVTEIPLLLPSSMETIAVLALASLNAIEDSQATRAWAFISAALNICQTLGYHRIDTAAKRDDYLQEARGRLFWTVYSFAQGLSLRLRRSTSIHDSDITLPTLPNEPLFVKVGRIQGRAYSQLYSQVSTSTPAEETRLIAHELYNELNDVMDESLREISEAAVQLAQTNEDPMRIVYLHGELVCQSSLSVLILRAIPSWLDPRSSEECAHAARRTLDLHQQCMTCVSACQDPILTRRYMNWAIQHVPFIPFSILFNRTIQVSDREDLAKLEQFAASLRPGEGVTDSATHPYRLYKLLCQAARIHIDSTPSTASDLSEQAFAVPEMFDGLGPDIVSSELDLNTDSFMDDLTMSNFSDWCIW